MESPGSTTSFRGAACRLVFLTAGLFVLTAGAMAVPSPAADVESGAPGAGTPGRPAAEEPAWEPLELRGIRQIDLTLDGRSRIRMRVMEAAPARFAVRALAEGGTGARAPGADRGLPGTPPPADGPPASLPRLDTWREHGVLYLETPSEPESPGESAGSDAPGATIAGPMPSIEMLLEVPASIGVSIHTMESEISLSGSPLRIADSLGPAVPRRERGQPPGAGGPVDNGYEAAGSEAKPDDALRPIGGSISIDALHGTVTVRDLLKNVTIDKQAGNVTLERLAGTVVVRNGVGPVEALAMAGSLSIEGASSVRAGAIHGQLEMQHVSGRVEVRGVEGETRVNGDRADMEMEDLRGAVTITLTDGTAALRRTMGAARFQLERSDLVTEEYDDSVMVKASGGRVEILRGAGAVTVQGEPDAVEIQQARGTVSINSQGRDVRVREVMGAVTVRCSDADIWAEEINGPVNLSTTTGQVRASLSTQQVRVAGDSVEVEIHGPVDSTSDHFYTAKRFVRLSLPDGKYDIRVRATGEIDSDFDYQDLVNPSADAALGAGRDLGDRGSSDRPDPSESAEDRGRAQATQQARRLAMRLGPRVNVNCDGDVEITRR